MPKRDAESFLNILRAELRSRGVDGSGVASVKVKDNHAVAHWLWQGRACRISLDRHYDRYMDGLDCIPALREALDCEFFSRAE